MAARKKISIDFPMPQHDHRHCAADALRTAEDVCRARRSRLTEIRKQVLKTVWSSHTPIGAYDILSRLNARGGKAAPMAIYRALDFLMENGLVHRIASLNAFVGCAHPGEPHAGHFLICRDCGNVAELDNLDVKRALIKAVAARGFTIDSEVIEIRGRCPHCHEHAP